MQKKPDKSRKNISIKNRKASFEYELLDEYKAGIVLRGSEIKALRSSQASIAEAYCYISNGELWVKGMHISEYTYAHDDNHEETRTRKLLLHRKELNKLQRSKDKGLTIVPTSIFINEKGLAKMNICLARGKKLYDKRQALKERTLKEKMRVVSSD